MFKYRRLNIANDTATGNVEGREELDIQKAFPIFGEFNIAISQMRRQSVDVSSRGASKIKSSHSGVYIDIWKREISKTFCSDHVEHHTCGRAAGPWRQLDFQHDGR